MRSNVTIQSLFLCATLSAAGCAGGGGSEQFGVCSATADGDLAAEEQCAVGDGARAVVPNDFGNATIDPNAGMCGQLLPGQQAALAQYINGLGLGAPTRIAVVVMSCAPPPTPASVDVYLLIDGQLVLASVNFNGLLLIRTPPPRFGVPLPPGAQLRALMPLPQEPMGI